MPNDKPKGWLGGGIAPLLLAAGAGAGGVWLIQRRRPGRGIAPFLLLAAGVGAYSLRRWWRRVPQNFRRHPAPPQEQQSSPPRQVGRQPRPATRGLMMSGEPLPIPVDDLSGWWPLEEPLVGHGRSDSPIYTFVSQFAPEKEQGLFGGGEEVCNLDGAAAPLPSSPATVAVAADVAFLRGLDLEGLKAGGAADAPLRRVMISPAVAAAAAAAGATGEEGKHAAYGVNNPPTPATLVADLKASANFKSAIVDLDDDGSGGPLPYLGYLVFYGADEVHEDETKQYIFSTPEDVAEASAPDAAAGEDEEFDHRDAVFQSRAQLAALKRYVLQERVFFVLVHTERVPMEFCPEPRGSDVLLMALGASVATGNLVGVMAIQLCHNLCD